jgi:hypothetical protein
VVVRNRHRYPIGVRRVVIIGTIVWLGVAGAVLAATLHAAVSQTLHGTVNADYSITLLFDDGSNATSAPAGSYRLVVNDQTSEHNFHLSGPGVDVDTGIDQVGTQGFTINLQNNSQYTFVCDVHPDTMRGTINIGTPPASSSPTSTGPGKPTTNVPAGPLGHKIAGTVIAAVSGTKVALLLNGKPVTRLGQGWYRIRVTKEALTLDPPKGVARHLAGGSSVTVRLTPGTWKYYASRRATGAHTFRVTG